MKHSFALWILALVVSMPALAIYKKGDTVPNMCWKNELNKDVCLDDYKTDLRVLLYNAGWCPPCNNEFSELVPQVKDFAKDPVTFISVSAEGWSHGDRPDTTFLSSWKKTYSIPFPVVGSYRDFGKNFFAPPNYIPSVVMIDAKAKVVYAEVNPGADVIVEKVRDLLP